jgi:nucleoid DNA-binding protein
LTQRSNFTIDGTEVELLQLAWQSARSKMTTDLKKGLKINIRNFMIFEIQQVRRADPASPQTGATNRLSNRIVE